MVALDAMPPDRLHDLVTSGSLPNMQRFLAGSTQQTVESEGGVISGSVWPTMVSGTSPGHHARYFSSQWLETEMRHVRAENEAFAYEPFWDRLVEAGKRVTVFDVPYLPRRDYSGIRIRIGWGMHDEVDTISEPPAFWKAFERRHTKSSLTYDLLEPQNATDRVKLAAQMIKSARNRTGILEELVGRTDWDVLLMNYSETHRGLHYLSDPTEQIREGVTNQDVLVRILRPLDDALPRIVAAAGDDCHIMLFSLHGTHHSVDLSTFAPALLALGRGEELATAEQMDPIRRIRNLLPRAVHEWLWRMLPADRRAARISALALAGTDFTKHEWFPMLHGDGPAFRVNLKGRERDGIVEPGRRDEVIAGIEKLIGDLATPEGAAAFAPVWRPQALYPGPRSHHLPDVTVTPNPDLAAPPPFLESAEGARLERTHAPVRSGGHTSAGFCAYRPAAGRESTRTAISNLDFAPTVLDALNIPVGDGLQGKSFVQ